MICVVCGKETTSLNIFKGVNICRQCQQVRRQTEYTHIGEDKENQPPPNGTLSQPSPSTGNARIPTAASDTEIQSDTPQELLDEAILVLILASYSILNITVITYWGIIRRSFLTGSLAIPYFFPLIGIIMRRSWGAMAMMFIIQLNTFKYLTYLHENFIIAIMGLLVNGFIFFLAYKENQRLQ